MNGFTGSLRRSGLRLSRQRPRRGGSRCIWQAARAIRYLQPATSQHVSSHSQDAPASEEFERCSEGALGQLASARYRCAEATEAHHSIAQRKHA